MKVKDGQAQATMTEVKNKIGEVFSLVDEVGSVTITSYNRPMYQISRIKSALGEKFQGKPTPKPSTLKIENDIIGILSGVGEDEIWQRDNRAEWSWIRNARKKY